MVVYFAVVFVRHVKESVFKGCFRRRDVRQFLPGRLRVFLRQCSHPFACRRRPYAIVECYVLSFPATDRFFAYPGIGPIPFQRMSQVARSASRGALTGRVLVSRVVHLAIVEGRRERKTCGQRANLYPFRYYQVGVKRRHVARLRVVPMRFLFFL